VVPVDLVDLVDLVVAVDLVVLGNPAPEAQ